MCFVIRGNGSDVYLRVVVIIDSGSRCLHLIVCTVAHTRWRSRPAAVVRSLLTPQQTASVWRTVSVTDLHAARLQPALCAVIITPPRKTAPAQRGAGLHSRVTMSLYTGGRRLRFSFTEREREREREKKKRKGKTKIISKRCWMQSCKFGHNYNYPLTEL